MQLSRFHENHSATSTTRVGVKVNNGLVPLLWVWYDHASTPSRLKEAAMKGNFFEYEYLFLLRGPTVIAVALALTLFSAIRTLSLMMSWQVVLLGLGISLTGFDMVKVGERLCHVYLQRQLDGAVWDDILRRVFNSRFDWVALLTTNLVGQAMWMYSLPFTASQRTKLLQAALGVNEKTATHILFEPGGFKEVLFPRSFLVWLESKCPGCEDEDAINSQLGSATRVVIEGNSSASGGSALSETWVSSQTESEQFDSGQCPTAQEMSKICAHTDNSLMSQGDCTANFTMLSNIFKEIIRDAVLEKTGLDSTHVATVGLGAAASLVFHLRLSRRARSILMFVLEASLMAGLSTVFFGSLALIISVPKKKHGAIQKNVLSGVAEMTSPRVDTRGRRVAVSSLILLALLAWKRYGRMNHSSINRGYQVKGH
jgi:hypothetical protein